MDIRKVRKTDLQHQADLEQGLPGVKGLMDEFELHYNAEKGTEYKL